MLNATLAALQNGASSGDAHLPLERLAFQLHKSLKKAVEGNGLVRAVVNFSSELCTTAREATGVIDVATFFIACVYLLSCMQTFWGKMIPIWIDYVLTQRQVANLPTAERVGAFERLHAKYAPKVRDMMGKLRGFFIKLAQLGSTRDDFMPPQYIEFFKEFQDAAPFSLDAEDAVRALENELGCTWELVFDAFDPVPFASATIGQGRNRV